MASASFSTEALALTRGQLLDLLLDVEERLKLLIRAVFVREAEDWISLIPKSIRAELEAAPSSAAQAMGESADLLDKATLKQLIGITLKQWKLFDPILKDRAWIQVRLEELRDARNALVHGYQPDADYKVKVALAVAELGKRIAAPVQTGPPSPLRSGRALEGRTVLWVDDHPEGNLWARRLLTGFGAEVVPVLSNDEALEEVKRRRFDVAVSDIHRGEGEPGTKLGVRLTGIGVDLPIVYYIAQLDHSMGVPYGAVAISNDMVAMLTSVLSLLRPDAVARSVS